VKIRVRGYGDLSLTPSIGTDMSQHEAVATSIVAMVPTGMAASLFHIRAGNVKLRASGETSSPYMYAYTPVPSPGPLHQ